MFTDRFIKIPVELYNIKEAEMVGYSDDTKEADTFMYVNPFEISHYRPCVDNDDELNNTSINMKNGDNFHASISVEEFEKLLNNLQP